jgi:transcriptional regulator with XRE-family HTH domain
MTMAAASSGVPRRLLGQCLRDLRQEVGLTVRVAATALEWSEPKMWRIETGQTAMRSLDVEAVCALYGAPPGLTRALAGLARHTRTEIWWHSSDQGSPDEFDAYARLEQQAQALQGYEPCQVPLLLRTEDYARALLTSSRPGLSTHEVDLLVHQCLARQALVTRASTPLNLSLILGEAVLRCPAGGAPVMAAQLRRLADLADRPNIGLRVLPFRAGIQPDLGAGAFTLLRFAPRAGDTGAATVVLRHLGGELYLDKPAEISLYEAAHTGIFEHSANELATQDLLLAAAKELCS